MTTLLSGLIIGMGFGFLLQKGSVIRYDRQMGALRLIDMTIIKFMFSAVLTGMVGVYVLKDLGIINLRVLPTILGGNIFGGILFGLGWGLLGYCPGTAMGALGEGRYDAAWGILGMIFGAGIYAEAYPALSRNILTWGRLKIYTIPQALGINHWIIIFLFVIGGIFMFRWFEKKGL
ncbi:MAG: YeeE/YedE family protein [Proteobacteria bacterium]|nr:YeeE/YedE family protein [Pseudomonadota bacterium]MBU1709309.1 YeeE/YedE family protein [Pseudomonadota bacterium]